MQVLVGTTMGSSFCWYIICMLISAHIDVFCLTCLAWKISSMPIITLTHSGWMTLTIYCTFVLHDIVDIDGHVAVFQMQSDDSSF